jgi:hypothetical protein
MESTIEVSQDSETENAIPLVDQDEAADDISAKVAIQEKVLESTEKTEIKDVVDTNDQDDDDEDDLDNNE